MFTVGCGNQAGDNGVDEAKDSETLNKSKDTEFTIPEYAKSLKGIEKFDGEIDYSNSENWMFLPEESTKEVDAIYLYPSAFGIANEAEDDIADIDDVNMRMMAIYYASSQASVFEESCNLYVPYYRQFTVNSLVDMIDASPEAMQYFASQDIYHMLDYYFENLNGGRPFILAGHSQGSVWLTVVLEDYMKEHPEYMERMVAAYIIGYSVTEDYLDANPHLKFAEGADDIGVIISYNTEGPGNKDAYNCVVREGAIAINPINWKLDDTYASIEENIGSLNAGGELVSGSADARVDTERGVVICTSRQNTPETKEMLAEYFGEESFHLYDYSFYYENLKKNVADRIAAFMK
ncbi:MAG: DUF3089 domain-containing protein [Roseburia sp.]|nr:DUF3089 domain-containing protein [Roseburia sp.]